jgi:hypothetical protein
MGRRITTHIRGNVVAYLALVVALSGTAYAAGKINGKQIKPNSIPGNRIRNGSLTGQQVNSSTLGVVPGATHAASADSAANADHSANADHATNSDQLGGASASDFGAVLTGRINGLTNLGNDSDTGAPSGLSTPSAGAANTMLSPDRALTARDLSVQLTSPPGGAAMRDFFLGVNGIGLVAFSCRIQGSATRCNTGSASLAIPPNSLLTIFDSTGTANPAAASAMFAVRLTP